MDNRERKKKKNVLGEQLLSAIVHPLPLNVCCASRSWCLIRDSFFCAHSPLFYCMSPQSLMWKVQHWMLHSNGENDNYSLWSKCTHCLLVYICILWPVYVVSDAVLCMLTCRWNMTTIHEQGQAGSHSVELINDCKLSVISTSRFFGFWKYRRQEQFNASSSWCTALSSIEEQYC